MSITPENSSAGWPSFGERFNKKNLSLCFGMVSGGIRKTSIATLRKVSGKPAMDIPNGRDDGVPTRQRSAPNIEAVHCSQECAVSRRLVSVSQ